MLTASDRSCQNQVILGHHRWLEFLHNIDSEIICFYMVGHMVVVYYYVWLLFGKFASLTASLNEIIVFHYFVIKMIVSSKTFA